MEAMKDYISADDPRIISPGLVVDFGDEMYYELLVKGRIYERLENMGQVIDESLKEQEGLEVFRERIDGLLEDIRDESWHPASPSLEDYKQSIKRECGERSPLRAYVAALNAASSAYCKKKLACIQYKEREYQKAVERREKSLLRLEDSRFSKVWSKVVHPILASGIAIAVYRSLANIARTKYGIEIDPSNDVNLQVALGIGGFLVGSGAEKAYNSVAEWWIEKRYRRRRIKIKDEYRKIMKAESIAALKKAGESFERLTGQKPEGILDVENILDKAGKGSPI